MSTFFLFFPLVQPQRPPQHHQQNPFPALKENPWISPRYQCLMPTCYHPCSATKWLWLAREGSINLPFPDGTIPTPHAPIMVFVLGNSIEQCVALKNKVQSLIDVGWLTFQEDSPNVRTNPLANHGGSTVNAVEEWESQGLKQIGDVSTSRRFIL